MRNFCLALLLTASWGVVASPAEQDDGFQDEQYILRAAALKGDALSDLAIAEMLTLGAESVDDDQRKQTLIATAERLRENVAGAEQDAILIALQLTQDWPPVADATKRVTRVQQLEAASVDNAFYAIPALHLPENRDAPAAAANLIHRAAQAPRYRSYFVPVGRSLSERFLALVRSEGVPGISAMAGVSPESQAFIFAMNVVAAVALPAYQPFVTACDKDAFDQLRVDCRRVATLMVTQGDTLIDAAIGIAVLRQIADGVPVLAQVQTLEREHSWLREQAMALSKDMHPREGANWTPEMDARFRRFAQAWLASGEVEAYRHLLREAQISELPPPHWRSPREKRQSAN